MRTIVLTHPKHGEIDKKKLQGKFYPKKVIKDWGHRYGKKFSECRVDIKKETTK